MVIDSLDGTYSNIPPTTAVLHSNKMPIIAMASCCRILGFGSEMTFDIQIRFNDSLTRSDRVDQDCYFGKRRPRTRSADTSFDSN
jgi:hypothetical protein